jgi:hypothetical protein
MEMAMTTRMAMERGMNRVWDSSKLVEAGSSPDRW